MQAKCEPDSSDGTKQVRSEHCGLAKLGGALNELGQATPPLKRQVLQACAEYIAADGRVAIAEAELLRATADALGCPMPPLLPGESS